MTEIACHMLVPLPKIRRFLRRYSDSQERKLEETLRKKMQLSPGTCPGKYGYCNTMAFLDEIDYKPKTVIEAAPDWSHDDPRWPKVCEYCNKAFKDEDKWQVFQQALYQRHDGTIVDLHDCQPGDMWDAWWYPDKWKQNPDGLCLVVRLPGDHDWIIDRSGSDNTHWIRTGTPPNITVTPSVIVQSSGYHGWLRNGILVDA